MGADASDAVPSPSDDAAAAAAVVIVVAAVAVLTDEHSL